MPSPIVQSGFFLTGPNREVQGKMKNLLPLVAATSCLALSNVEYSNTHKSKIRTSCGGIWDPWPPR